MDLGPLKIMHNRLGSNYSEMMNHLSSLEKIKLEEIGETTEYTVLSSSSSTQHSMSVVIVIIFLLGNLCQDYKMK